MKKIFLILIPLILIGFLTVLANLPQPVSQKTETKNENQNKKDQIRNIVDISPDHSKQGLKCKSCHSCEYPTKEDPCLLDCPRTKIDPVNRSPQEGPNVVIINEMSENYTGVVFSHKVHAQMSAMSIGCSGCHHYNTTGPILNCRKCHEDNRARENVSVPDLKAAYHRQCATSHKEWSHENGCNGKCHLKKGSENQNPLQKNVDAIKDKSHPTLTEPTKLIFQTNSDAGKIVTFFHNEHNLLFKINCANCHNQDNCLKCHDKNKQKGLSNSGKTIKSFEEQHKTCIKCHSGNSCQKCHKEKENTPFNHAKTSGWTLKGAHSQLACSKCHGNNMPYKKLDNNCTSCHKNFVQGKFDHKVIGWSLSDAHKELECDNCHSNKDFSKGPKCNMCHDDKSFPAQLPGKKGKN